MDSNCVNTIRVTVLQELERLARFANASKGAIVDEMKLEDAGIDSMGVISLLVALEKRIGLQLERISNLGRPETVGDMIRLAISACSTD